MIGAIPFFIKSLLGSQKRQVTGEPVDGNKGGSESVDGACAWFRTSGVSRLRKYAISDGLKGGLLSSYSLYPYKHWK